MQIYLRSLNPHVTGGEGQVLLGKSKRDGTYWAIYEALLKECLIELGHDLIEQPENIKFPDIDYRFDQKIYAHGTKRLYPDVDYFYMQMHLADLFVFDSEGWGNEHSKKIKCCDYNDINLDLAKKWVRRESKRMLNSGKSKHKQRKENLIKFDVRRKLKRISAGYLLVPIQTPRDYTITYHSPVSVLDYIHIVGNWAGENKIPLLFKLHPYNKRDYEIVDAVNNLSQKYSCINIFDANIHHLIHRSSGVLVINSGVGFEALFHDKPVITFGECDYKEVTLHMKKGSLDKITEYIRKYNKEKSNQVSKFLYYYCHSYGYLIREEEYSKSKIRLMQYLEQVL